jgi:hypothetical protein
MEKKKRAPFKKENCRSVVKNAVTIGKTTITLTSTHAFEWCVAVDDGTNTTVTVFSKMQNGIRQRDLAKAEFRRKAGR